MELLMVGFNSRADAQTAFEAIDDLQSDKEVVLEDLALVYKNDKGKVKLRQTEDAGIGRGLVRGGVLGLLVGIVAPIALPGVVAATVAGGALGGVITAFDDGIDNKMMKSLGDNMKTREGVLLMLGEKQQIKALEDGFAPYSDELTYETVPEATQRMIRELAKLSIEELGSSAA